jgi:hypothetical protein
MDKLSECAERVETNSILFLSERRPSSSRRLTLHAGQVPRPIRTFRDGDPVGWTTTMFQMEQFADRLFYTVGTPLTRRLLHRLSLSGRKKRNER